MKTRYALIYMCIGILALPLVLPSPAAADAIGSVVAFKGDASIERSSKVLKARLKEGIEVRDSVATGERSRMKMLFVDESILTLGEKSKMVIQELGTGQDRKLQSTFNLIDGKLRSVVGKSGFEVRTPTLVAAARGTVFDCEAGHSRGQAFTTCTSYEGVVEIRSIDPTITGLVTLRPGMSVTVTSGQPLPAPTMAPKTSVQPVGSPVSSLSFVQGSTINMTPPQTKPADTGRIRVGW